MMTASRPARILFVGGWGRSGSTLLDRILGRVPGFVAVGELRDVFLRGPAEDRLCGCGSSFSTCPFWGDVGEVAFGGWDRVDAGRLAGLRPMLDRPWDLARLLRPGLSRSYAERHREYVGALSALYGAIHDVSGEGTIVDSSKIASYALLLRGMPGADLRVLHLVRDSRGVVFSWRKHVLRRDRPDRPEAMRRYGVLSAAVRYDLYNALTEGMRLVGTPYLKVRYEDLIGDPQGVVAQVVAFGGGDPASSASIVSGSDVLLDGGHGIDGNPMRFRHGVVALREDDEWRRAMPTRDRRVVSALTVPMLARYGYDIRV